MSIQIYADGSDPDEMVKAVRSVSGFTTNPSLMRAAGTTNYEEFVKDILLRIPNLPISFEVFSDDLQEMERQAYKLAEFGDNVYVKVPICNTLGVSTAELIQKLLCNKVKVNVTAVFTYPQIKAVIPFMVSSTEAILSIFAGRIADTGINPSKTISWAISVVPPNVKVLWASCREVYNVYEADQIGCHIITVPNNIISKLSLRDKDLEDYSLETVKMFYDDAKSCGFTL